MAKLLQRTFFKAMDGFWQTGHGGKADDGEMSICPRRLAEYFEIPKDVSRIWVALHDRAGANRYAMTIDRHDESQCFITIEDTKTWEISLDHGEKYAALLDPLLDRKLYVEVTY